MYDGVTKLLASAGVGVRSGSRDYRPSVGMAGVETKILQPQAIVEMLNDGIRDVGFAGADWVAEREADVVELLDTGLDRVRLIVAAPVALLEDGTLPDRPRTVPDPRRHSCGSKGRRGRGASTGRCTKKK